jgi:drug/metabolite transporter (DMT)-like permease
MLSVVLFTLMAVCIKSAAPHVPPGEAVFFRSAFAVPVILGWLAWTRRLRHGLATEHPLGHFWRGFLGTASMGLGFAALGLLPLPEATALGYAAPLLTVIFAAMFLGEKVHAFRLSAVFIGLLGVVIVLSPRLTLTDPSEASALQAFGAMAALFGAVCGALAQVTVRKLISTEATGAIVFYYSATSVLLSLVTIPFGWTLPDGREAALLIGAGVLGGVAQIFLTESYRHAEAGVIAPFEYVSMLLALGFGYLIFGEVPTRPMLLGAGVIVAAGLFIIWRERRLGIARAGARKVTTPQG